MALTQRAQGKETRGYYAATTADSGAYDPSYAYALPVCSVGDLLQIIIRTPAPHLGFRPSWFNRAGLYRRPARGTRLIGFTATGGVRGGHGLAAS